jgi:RHS repeat-associated protein
MRASPLLSTAALIVSLSGTTLNAQVAGPPFISLDDHHGGYRDVSKCVADCFDVVAKYSTPAYYSADIARSVQLIYRSSLARPLAFLNIGAWDTTAGYPAKMSVRVQDALGVNVTFTNGSTEFFFSCPTTGGNQVCDSTSNRLAVQFDVSSKATRAYVYTVFVRSYRPDNSFAESSKKVRVLVHNEATSPFGAGWGIIGYERLYFVNDSLLITSGDGSSAFFRNTYCPDEPSSSDECEYASPAGDFTEVSGGWFDVDGAKYRRRYPDGTIVGFRGDGRIRYRRDSHGRKTIYIHDTSTLLLVDIRDPIGKDYLLGYVSGKLRWIKDPGGRTDSITVNASGDLTRIKDAVGGLPFQGTYNSLHRLTNWTDRRGGAWGTMYDFAGKRMVDTAPAITTVHGSGERPVQRFVSLETALLSDTSLHLGTSANPAPSGNSRTVRASITSPRGFVTRYALDRFGQPSRIEQPLGRNSRFTLDTLGRHLVDSLPPGHLIRYSWSGANLTQWKDSTTGRVINYVYDATFNMLTLRWGDIDSLINVLTSDESAVDKTRVGGSTVWTEHNYVTTPRWYHQCSVTGLATSYRATCTYPSGTGFQNTDSVYVTGAASGGLARSFHQYDGHGQRIRTINPVLDTTWTQYDSLGRTKRLIGPQRDTTSYTYDSLYLTQVRDARGQIYRVWPNALGWPDSTMDAAGRLTRFTYDSSGNEVTIVNRRGEAIQFTYDSLDQARRRIVGSDTTRYFTDPLGWYKSTRNHESIDTLRLDAAGRPLVEISCRVLTVGSAAQCFRDSSTYDGRDLRTKLMVTAPGLWSTHTATYHFNQSLLLDTMTNFSGHAQAFTYNGEHRDSTRKFLALNNLILTYGRPALGVNVPGSPYSPWIPHSGSLTFSNPTLTGTLGASYTFNTVSRVTEYFHGTPATPDTIRSLRYTANRLSRFADTAYAWSSSACSLKNFGESCNYGLVQSKNAVGSPKGFFYDIVGNRQDSLQAYVDSGNRLRRLGFVRMDYDFDGNLTRKRVLSPVDTTKAIRTDSLFWSAVGQLDSLHRADSTGTQTLRVIWGYDGMGREIRQSVAGETIRFLWDGSNRVFKLDSLGGRLAYWTYYPGMPEPQSMAFTDCSSGSCTPFTTLYYVTDGLRNTIALIEAQPPSSYVVRNQFRYGPYGDSLAVTGLGANVGHLRYKGAYYDGYARLYRMGARFYDPDVGRFISEDPAGLRAGLNQYAFAGGDPVIGYDPSGEFFFLPALAFFAIAIGEAAIAAGPFLAALPAAIGTASEVLAVTAIGSAVSAHIESVATGTPFGEVFLRNFDIAGGFLLAGVISAAIAGGGYAGAGTYGLQGYVRSEKPLPLFGRGGMTAGPAAAYSGVRNPLTAAAPTSVTASLAAHEFGHTIQFMILSAFGDVVNPWLSYGGLGVPGFLGWRDNPWENFASRLGR